MVLNHTLFVPSISDRKSVLISFSVIMLVFGIVAIEVWDTELPVWAFILSLSIGDTGRIVGTPRGRRICKSRAKPVVEA